MKTVTLGEYLTDEQIAECLRLYPDLNAIVEEVIKPNMAEINRKLGQDNDARYLGYMVIYVIEAAAMKTDEKRGVS